MPSAKREARVTTLFPQGRSVYKTERYGIEIELEKTTAPSPFDIPNPRIGEQWTAKGDGSLRNGVELVSEPLQARSVKPALEYAYAWAQMARYAPSARCGLHVHVNMAGRSVQNLADVLGAYSLAEPYLFAVAGMEREQSIYCVPWYIDFHQYAEVAELVREVRDGQVRLNVDGDNRFRRLCKYSALNLLPLTQFHTVEFRHAPVFETAGGTLNWTMMIRELTTKASWVAAQSDPITSLRTMLAPFMTEDQRVQAANKFDDYYVAERYERFVRQMQPCTYKAAGWGLPARLEAEARGMPVRSRALSKAEKILREYSEPEPVEEENDFESDDETVATDAPVPTPAVEGEWADFAVQPAPTPFRWDRTADGLMVRVPILQPLNLETLTRENV